MAEAMFVHAWNVGPFTVTISIPPIVPGEVRRALCEWSPSVPRRHLTDSEQLQYDTGLAEAMTGATRK